MFVFFFFSFKDKPPCLSPLFWGGGGADRAFDDPLVSAAFDLVSFAMFLTVAANSTQNSKNRKKAWLVPSLLLEEFSKKGLVNKTFAWLQWRSTFT